MDSPHKHLIIYDFFVESFKYYNSKDSGPDGIPNKTLKLATIVVPKVFPLGLKKVVFLVQWEQQQNQVMQINTGPDYLSVILSNYLRIGRRTPTHTEGNHLRNKFAELKSEIVRSASPIGLGGEFTLKHNAYT